MTLPLQGFRRLLVMEILSESLTQKTLCLMWYVFAIITVYCLLFKSVYCKSKISEEIIREKAFVFPDGTSRQGIGNIVWS